MNDCTTANQPMVRYSRAGRWQRSSPVLGPVRSDHHPVIAIFPEAVGSAPELRFSGRFPVAW